MHSEYLAARIRAAANKLAEGSVTERVISDAFHALADELEDESAREDVRRGFTRPAFPAPGRVWDKETQTYGPYVRPEVEPEVGSGA